MSRQAVKCVVSGRVQGVFFRAATAKRAETLGIDGWVINRDDGSVEVVAEGDRDAMEQFVAWLWEGPPGARVTGVAIEEWLEPVGAGFDVRH